MWTAQDHQHLPKLTTGRSPLHPGEPWTPGDDRSNKRKNPRSHPPESTNFRRIPWCFGKCKHPFRYSNFGVSMLDFMALTGNFNSLGFVIIKIAQRVFVPPHLSSLSLSHLGSWHGWTIQLSDFPNFTSDICDNSSLPYDVLWFPTKIPCQNVLQKICFRLPTTSRQLGFILPTPLELAADITSFSQPKFQPEGWIQIF